MRQVWIERFGKPEALRLREAPDPLPGPRHVRIRVEAIGVNFADVMGRLGLYPDLPKRPVVPGYEVAGKVDAVGAEVEPDWIGRDVLALTRFGGYTDTACVPEVQLATRPADMSAPAGAALPVNYLTAWQIVEVMGGLRAGQTVLVHSAGGGVGIATLQLAKRIGARVIGTASSAKHESLARLGLDFAIDPARDDFEARVREYTRGRGVDLVLDAVGGASFRKSYRCLAPTGRLAMFGLSAAASGKRRNPFRVLATAARTPWFHFNPARLIHENKGVFGVNLAHLWDEIDRVNGWLDALLGCWQRREIAPLISATFPLERAAEAHHYLQDRKNVGKVVLVP
ncbi:MAG TPA: medium chain dehydrogenase/reductase family protein [Myxococcota bacterium]|nr:medium chain dehydrogenase/reductase family protein [Myxococcota bacterium]